MPWQTQDLEGLVSGLPDLHEGAQKWILDFDEKTLGRLLALGDVKALLARVIGQRAMEDVMTQTGLGFQAVNVTSDGIEFNPHRNRLWDAMRAAYPRKLDLKTLKGDPIGETENPSAYVHGMKKKWRTEAGRNPDQDDLMKVVFRTMILEGLPDKVKIKLEDVIGLAEKTFDEFVAHVVHAVDKYRQAEQKIKDQEGEVLRKVAQLQLGELAGKNKRKEKSQAAIVDQEPVPQMPVTVTSAPPTGQQVIDVQQPSQAPAPAIPVIHVHTQAGREVRGQVPRGGQPQVNQGLSVVCWGCGQPGHFQRVCPTNSWMRSGMQGRLPWGSLPRMDQRMPRPNFNQGQPGVRGGQESGPVNYWGRQNEY